MQLNPDQFKFEYDASKNHPGMTHHSVDAYHPDYLRGEHSVGHLYWTEQNNTHTIDLINVEERHRRQGIGSRLYQEATRYTGGKPLGHSTVRSPDGKHGGGDSWARKVGGPLPENRP